MSDPPPGDVRSGVFSTMGKVVSRLSPEFLGLLLVDALFIVSVIYLLREQNNSRERVLGPVLSSCLEAVPMEALKMIARPESGGLQEAIGNLRQQMTEAGGVVRDQSRQIDGLKQAIEGLRPAIETLRNDLTRDTRARLQGPTR